MNNRFAVWRTGLIILGVILSIGIGFSSRITGAQIMTPTPDGSLAAPVFVTIAASGSIGGQTPFLGAVTTASANGATVQQIVSGSPAEQAGLQVGDLIQSVDGQPVNMQTPLSAILARHLPGDLVLFVITRSGVQVSIPVTLGSRPSSLATDTPIVPGGFGTPAGGYLGIGLAFADPGFRVEKVDPGSGADHAGIKVGDLITALGGQNITSVDQAHAIIQSKAPGASLSIALQRNNQPMAVTATLGSVPGAATITPLASATLTATNTPSATPIGAVTATPLISAAPPNVLVPTSTTSASGVHLGVTYDVLTAGLAAARGLSVSNGALITSITPGSPADIAGIKVGDVITAVDNQPVDTTHLLAAYMAAHHDGDTFMLTVVRTGQTLKISVTLAVSGSA